MGRFGIGIQPVDCLGGSFHILGQQGGSKLADILGGIYQFCFINIAHFLSDQAILAVDQTVVQRIDGFQIGFAHVFLGIIKRTHTDGGQDICVVQKPLFDCGDHFLVDIQIATVTVEDDDHLAGKEQILDLNADAFRQIIPDSVQNQIEVDVGFFLGIGFDQ